MKKIFTIGHSNRSEEYFLQLLKENHIEYLIDIRSLPQSRFNPHFNKKHLLEALAIKGITYIHMPNLGGRRTPNKESKNVGWKNEAFKGYADYAETQEFQMALQELKKLTVKHRSALMCAEALPWKCHRTIVSDYLTLEKWQVLHIMGNHSLKEHSLTPFLKEIEGKITYVNLS